VSQSTGAMAFAALRLPDREDSLRTALREYLAALDRGHLMEAELIERCTLGPRTGPVTLLLPLVRGPVRGRALLPGPPA
jgi:hypothetical protein